VGIARMPRLPCACVWSAKGAKHTSLGRRPRKTAFTEKEGLKARNIYTRRATMCRAYTPVDEENPVYPALRTGLACRRAVGALEEIMSLSCLTGWVI